MQSVDRDALDPVEPESRWPGRLRQLAASWRTATDAGRRERILAEFWSLLNQALQRYARLYARRLGGVSFEDIVDIAADKAIELLGRMETQVWDPAVESDGRMAAFLATVARNGVVDWIRRRTREHGVLLVPAEDDRGPRRHRATGMDDVVGAAIDGGRYARALVDCAGGLTARARQAWILRVFAGLSPAQIATHPNVRTSLGGVHLMLNRCRRRLRQCLASKGFDPGRMPAGTFVALWELVESGRGVGARRPFGGNRS